MNNNYIMSNKKDIDKKADLLYVLLEGKRYIYKEEQNNWIKFVLNSIKENPNSIYELKTTVDVMRELSNTLNSLDEVSNKLKDAETSTGSLCHIVNNILKYYKDGPDFFKIFYKGYINTDLLFLIEKLENKNNQLKTNEKQLIRK